MPEKIGRITGKPVLVVAQPLSDALGQTMAVVFAALDLEWLGRLTFEVEEQLPEGSILTQLDHSGIILARKPDPKKWIGKPMPEMNLVTAVQKKGKGLIEARDSNGVPCLYAFTPLRSVLKGRDVYLILEISKEIAFDSVVLTDKSQINS